MELEHVKTAKAAVSAFFAVLTALWGWFGWLILLWFVCLVLDYLTGSAAALRNGLWSSRAARDGIWHKLGSVVAVLTAGILDLTIGMILQNLPGVSLPFDYEVFFCPLVVIWYILTECGSIVENAAALGAEIPRWLARALAALRDRVDETAGPEDGGDGF